MPQRIREPRWYGQLDRRELAETTAWFRGSLTQSPPSVIADAFCTPPPGDVDVCLVAPGCGVNIAQQGAELVRIASRLRVGLLFAESAQAFTGALLMLAQTPEERIRALHLLSDVRLEEFFDESIGFRYGLPRIPAMPTDRLAFWAKEGTRIIAGDRLVDELGNPREMTWADVEYGPGRPRPKHLNGYKHALQFTLTVVMLDPKQLRAATDRDYEAGDRFPINFFDAYGAAVRTHDPEYAAHRAPRIGDFSMFRQLVFPGDLYDRDDPSKLGPLAWALYPVHQSSTVAEMEAWLNTESVIDWACIAAAHQLGLQAHMVVTTPARAHRMPSSEAQPLFGMLFSDGGAAGPPRLMHRNEVPPMPVVYAAGSGSRLWSPYRGNPFVIRSPLAPERMPPTRFKKLNEDVSADMAAGGFLHGALGNIGRLTNEQLAEALARVQAGIDSAPRHSDLGERRRLPSEAGAILGAPTFGFAGLVAALQEPPTDLGAFLGSETIGHDFGLGGLRDERPL